MLQCYGASKFWFGLLGLWTCAEHDSRKSDQVTSALQACLTVPNACSHFSLGADRRPRLQLRTIILVLSREFQGWMRKRKGKREREEGV